MHLPRVKILHETFEYTNVKWLCLTAYNSTDWYCTLLIGIAIHIIDYESIAEGASMHWNAKRGIRKVDRTSEMVLPSLSSLKKGTAT